MNHVKMLTGLPRPLGAGTSLRLVDIISSNDTPDHSGQAEMKVSTMLSNKTSTA